MGEFRSIELTHVNDEVHLLAAEHRMTGTKVVLSQPEARRLINMLERMEDGEVIR